MKQGRTLVDGPILQSLFSLAVPIVSANLLQTAYQLIDTFWVGRLGAEAVAAVSLSFPVIFLLISLGGGITIAGSVLVAHYKGRSDQGMVDHISMQALLIMVVVSVVISVAGYHLSPYLIDLMNPEPAVRVAAVDYLQISFAGLIFLFGFFVFQSLMRGVGNVTLPLYLVLTTVLLNLVLDPLFILGWGPIPPYGVAGAALATIGTQSIAFLAGIALLWSGRYDIRLRRADVFFDLQIFRRMVRLGFPASVEQSTRALGLMFMTLLVASFNTVAVAAYGIGIRVLSFIIIPAIGLAMATSTFVGQNMGAGKTDRAERAAYVSAGAIFAILTVVGLVLFGTARTVTSAFVPGEDAVIDSAALFVRLMALTFGFLGVQQVINGVFRGSGNTRTSMMIALVSLWILEFPLAYFLSKHTPLAEQGIWWAFPAANILSALLAWTWFRRGSWKATTLSPADRLIGEVSDEVITEEGVHS